MLLMLEDEHKEHLGFLTSVSDDVVGEFCRISMEFIRKGTNAKVYQSAAQKLGVPAETVQQGVEGLMYLFTESSKLLLNEVDFHDSIMALGFSEELKQQLLAVYQQNQKEIRQILSQVTMDLPHYHHLDWRFDVQLASRSLHHQTNPVILFKLHTEDAGEKAVHILQTDPTNLLHLTRELDTALQELKTAHCRRIVRNI